MSTRYFPTALGLACVSWNDTGLTRIRLPDPDGKMPEPMEPAPPEIRKFIARTQAYFTGRSVDFSGLQLDWSQVTPFQRKVYEAALAIAPGQTRSYGDLARQLGLGPEGARAVGTALGDNPWPLVVPCHRVVAADGRLTGFSAPGGTRTKARMLALEGALLLAE